MYVVLRENELKERLRGRFRSDALSTFQAYFKSYYVDKGVICVAQNVFIQHMFGNKDLSTYQ